jgi:hypothetical protein
VQALIVICPQCGSQRLLRAGEAKERRMDFWHPCWMKTATRGDGNIVSNGLRQVGGSDRAARADVLDEFKSRPRID